jgi:cellobiose transport system substrate-binding protein
VKKYKKIIGIAVIVTFILGIVGINGVIFGNSKENVTLTMWYWNRSVEDQLIKDVSKVYPNIEINAVKIGGDYNAKLKTTLAAKAGMPDIFCVNVNLADYFKYKDKFVNLLKPPYNAGELKKYYFEWKWNMCLTPDAKALIALPMDTGPTGLFYRKDYVEKVGLPGDLEKFQPLVKTWDGYFNVAQKLKKIGVYSTDNVGQLFTSMIYQIGGVIFVDKNGKWVGERKQIRNIFDAAVKAHKLGISAKVGRWSADWPNAISAGKIGMFTGAVWMKQILKDAAPNLSGKWRVVLMPGGSGNEGGSFICISASSKHPYEAWLAIKWMMSPENQKRQLKTMSLFPSAKDVFNDPSVLIKEDYFGGQVTNKVFAESAKSIPVFYYAPETWVMEGYFTEQLTLVENQNKDPQKAWEDAIKNIKKRYSFK